MSTEEPAWKAELKSAVLNAVIDSEKFRGVRWTPTTDAVMAAIGTHILAAEERGRREALKGHIKGLKADWARFRGRVLQEAWEAMRDAEGGPLIDAMGVINDLLEKK